MEKGTISMEFYNECNSVTADFRRFMYSEKLLFSDCKLLSMNVADQFVTSEIRVSDIERYITQLLKILFN